MSEIELAQSLKASRTPIREAFRQLQAEGYISLELNKGAYVSKMPPEEIAEVYDIVSLLEGYAAELAAQRIAPLELDRLKDIQRELLVCTAQKRFHDYVEKNAEFHRLITLFSGKITLSKTISELRARIYRYRLTSVTIPGYLRKYASHHDKIIEALSRRDAAAARRSMKSHVDFVKEILVHFLKDNPGF